MAKVKLLMSSGEDNPDITIVPVAGAFNLGWRRFSTGTITFGPIINQLRPYGDVKEPIVPANLGLFELDKVYEQFNNQLMEVISEAPENKVLFVAHSLGGLLCEKHIAGNVNKFNKEQYLGMIGLGVPHTNPRMLERYFPLIDKVWNNRARKFADFAKEVTADYHNNKEAPRLTLIGADCDGIVRAESALADGLPLPADRYYLDSGQMMPLTHSSIKRVPTKRPNRHVSMFISPETINLVGELAAKMTGCGEDIAELPQPRPEGYRFGEAV